MKSLDHFVLMVEDQEAARERYQRLGFHVRPTALHIELGSTNAVVIFPETYIELLYLGDSKAILRDQYLARFACGPGLAHVSLTATELAEEDKRLKALGYTPGPLGSARRKVIMPDGREDETDSNYLYNWRPEHRFLSLFFSEHKKPHAIFIDGYFDHPNGARGIAGTVAMSQDPAADLAYFEDAYGGKAETVGPDGFTMRGGRGDTFEVLSVAAANARFGDLLAPRTVEPLGAFPVAIRYRVDDLARTADCLAKNGVATVSLDGGLAIAAADAEGTIQIFQTAG
ncbi:MAG: VOC family protein [Acuticoccus sp.]